VSRTEHKYKPSMKIDCIRTHHLRHELDGPFGFSQWYYGTRNALWVEIIADDGTTGWGECYGPAEVYQAAVTSFYAPRLAGLDPLAIDRLWHGMWQWSLDFARGGIMMGAMSGIDMALWDLKGKALGLSVSELMGGHYRDCLPCYATGMYFRQLPEDALIDALVAEAVEYRNQGFEAMKIKVGKNLDFDIRLIAAVRRALPDTALMADSNHAYDLPEAIRVGRALDEHGFAWFEEPLSPEYGSQFRQLHDKIGVPLAAGECEQTRYGFQRLLSPGGVQIAQPDLAYCGGISEALKIRSIASSLGVNVVPHCWGTMLNLAAATHFLATGFREPGRAEDGGAVLELDRTPNPLRDELFTTPVTLDGATVHVPTAPGLGVVVDRAAVGSFRVRETEVR
jgi:D-galactarolactone cycloisomerase